MRQEGKAVGRGGIRRRDFLKAAAAAAAAPYVITSPALGGSGRPAASNRIAMGFIGVGGQGGGHLRASVRHPEIEVLAVCDVDARHRDRAKAAVDSRRKGCAAYGDFRELLARDDIDAVLIATPDHWHALISIAAAQAGKDIYCEKPFATTIAEGRAVCQAVKRYGAVFQTGSQERSNGRCRYACELVRNGRIGRLHTVRMNLPTDNRRCGPQPAMPVPKGFDYDTWLGPAPAEPYTARRCHFNFRWILDYSDGELTDRGAHVNDIGQWGAGMERSGPVAIGGKGDFPADGLWNTATGFHVEGEYASGVKLVIASTPPRGIRFEGTEGWIFVNIHGGQLQAEPASVLTSRIGPNETHLYRSGGHRADWLRAIRTRGRTVAPAEVGHRTVSLCHLANISMLLGRKLKWDPKEERFVGDAEANRMLARPMRPPWHL